MNFEQEEKQLVNKLVTYSVEVNGEWILVKNVPARVNEKTGEQFFASDTVERLQDMILGEEKPLDFIQVPVYQFTNVAKIITLYQPTKEHSQVRKKSLKGALQKYAKPELITLESRAWENAVEEKYDDHEMAQRDR